MHFGALEAVDFLLDRGIGETAGRFNMHESCGTLYVQPPKFRLPNTRTMPSKMQDLTSP